jgi:hypothetical protein
MSRGSVTFMGADRRDKSIAGWPNLAHQDRLSSLRARQELQKRSRDCLRSNFAEEERAEMMASTAEVPDERFQLTGTLVL